MPIIKEWRCRKCSHEFERIRDECPMCHEPGATRVFLTPPRIQSGSAKRTDAVLQYQFDKMGITNFSNVQGQGAPNKVTWKPKHCGPGPHIAAQGGQPAIEPTNNFQGIGLDPTQLARTVDTPSGPQTVPYSVPNDVGAGIPWGVPIGGRPEALYKNTRIVGKIDSDGREIKRVG